jgi:hypothetical protein
MKSNVYYVLYSMSKDKYVNNIGNWKTILLSQQ